MSVDEIVLNFNLAKEIMRRGESVSSTFRGFKLKGNRDAVCDFIGILALVEKGWLREFTPIVTSN